MTDHDSLCPATLGRYVSGTGFTSNECQCWLIAKVRADEREQVSRGEDMIYARAWDEVSNEVIAKVEAYERLLNTLAPVVRWGCAPALGGGLTDVDGVWASEIFKVLPDLEPYVLALIEKDSDD